MGGGLSASLCPLLKPSSCFALHSCSDIPVGFSVAAPSGGGVGVFHACCGHVWLKDGATCVRTWLPVDGSSHRACYNPSGIWMYVVPFVFSMVDVTCLPSTCLVLSSLRPPGCSVLALVTV